MIERVCGVCGKTFRMSEADQANWLSAWGASLDDVICPDCLDKEYGLLDGMTFEREYPEPEPIFPRLPKIPQWIEDIDWEPVRNVKP